jgi:hypothetical protein
VHPEFVAVNINGPMPACTTHLDNPSFYGAIRVDYPLPFLRVMGSSGLFDAWRVVRASAISWFYDGTGGNFDYWPEGLDGPMGYVPALPIARTYIGLGETADALRWLDTARAERDPFLGSLMVFPAYDAIRDQPEFRRLARELKLST